MAKSFNELTQNTEGLIEFVANSLHDIGCTMAERLCDYPDEGNNNWIIEIEFWGRETNKWVTASSGAPVSNALGNSNPNRSKWPKLLAVHKALKMLAMYPQMRSDKVVQILVEMTRMGLIELGSNFSDQMRLQDILDNL